MNGTIGKACPSDDAGLTFWMSLGKDDKIDSEEKNLDRGRLRMFYM